MLEPVTAMNCEMSVKISIIRLSDPVNNYFCQHQQISSGNITLVPEATICGHLVGARLFLGDVCTHYYDPDTLIVFRCTTHISIRMYAGQYHLPSKLTCRNSATMASLRRIIIIMTTREPELLGTRPDCVMVLG